MCDEYITYISGPRGEARMNGADESGEGLLRKRQSYKGKMSLVGW